MTVIKQISDQYGFVVECTPMDELRTVIPIRLVGATFVGTTLDTNFWTSAILNSASIAQANNQVVLTSGTNTAGSITLTSTRTARYTGGSANRYRAQIQLSNTGTASNSRKWGVRNSTTDGAYFELDGTTMYIVTLKTGAATRVASTSWNESTTVPTLTSINSYEIYWTNSKVYFVIAGVLMHTVSASTATWSDTTNFQVFAQNVNAGSSTSVTISIRVNTIYRLGNLETNPVYYHLSGNAATHTLKLGPGILHKIIFNNTGGTDITIVDNVTGTTPVIGIITTTTAAIGEWDYSIPFNTGLILITIGNGLDATVVYE